MTTRAPKTKRRATGSRGAALVEFALILPILVLLICAIIDFGATFNNWQQLRQGTRQGARAASVTDFGTNTTCGTTALGGPGSGTKALNLLCRIKDKIGLGDDVRVGLWLPDSGVSPKAWVSGGTLRICTQYRASSLTGILRPVLDDKVFTSRVDIRIEQDLATGDSFGELKEQALAGTGSWPGTCGS